MMKLFNLTLILCILLFSSCARKVLKEDREFWTVKNISNDTIVLVFDNKNLYLIEKRQNYFLIDSAVYDSVLLRYVSAKSKYEIKKSNNSVYLACDYMDSLHFTFKKDLSLDALQDIVTKASFNSSLLGVWSYEENNKQVKYCSVFNNNIVSIRSDNSFVDDFFSNYYIADSTVLMGNSSNIKGTKRNDNFVLYFDNKSFEFNNKINLDEPLVLIQENEIFTINGAYLTAKELKRTFWSYWLNHKFHANFLIKVSNKVSFSDLSQTKELIRLMNNELKFKLHHALEYNNDSSKIFALDELYPCLINVVSIE